MIGEELIGAGAFSKTNYYYRKLSKLISVTFLATEMQSLLEQRFSCEVNTPAFTKKAISMKYRVLFELYLRKNSMLNYIARMGKCSLKEGYNWWENNHSQMVLIK